MAASVMVLKKHMVLLIKKQVIRMNFEKMSIMDIFQYNLLAFFSFTILGVFTILIGIVLYKISDVKLNQIIGRSMIFMGILAVIIPNITVFTNNQSKALMNGETTTDVQSVYHINDDKIAKLNIDGHPIRLSIDDDLKKGDRISIKAKNVEILKNNTIRYNNLKGKQSFQYEKVNE